MWPFESGPASPVKYLLLPKFSSSSDRGSKLAARQVFFKRKFIGKMFDIEALKNLVDLATSEKIRQILKNFRQSPNL